MFEVGLDGNKVDWIKVKKLHEKTTHALYIDDISELEAINLQNRLISDTSDRPQPLK